MMNAVTIAFAHLLEKGQLDESDQERLVGLLLTRALTADKRLMVDSRRIAVQDLFTLISKDQGLAFTHQLKELGTHNKIRFRGQSFRDVL
jgi:hypothetical protein